jgi:lipopolysaccharide cholinephosphotransferase
MIKDVRGGVREVALNLGKVLIENKILFFLVGGSAIGAIRENGMVEWDDDCDFAFKRKDIKKIEKAVISSNKTNKYHFVIPEKEKNYFLITYKLVNNNGELSNYTDRGTNLNGAFVDLFPLDKTPNFKLIRRFHQLLIRLDKVALDIQLGRKDTGKKLGILKNISRFIALHQNGKKIQKRMIRNCKMFNWLPGAFRYYNFGTPYGVDKEMYLTDEIRDVKFVDFEGEKLPVAIGYDSILKRTYGNYMKKPKESERHAAHLINNKNRQV